MSKCTKVLKQNSFARYSTATQEMKHFREIDICGTKEENQLGVRLGAVKKEAWVWKKIFVQGLFFVAQDTDGSSPDSNLLKLFGLDAQRPNFTEFLGDVLLIVFVAADFCCVLSEDFYFLCSSAASACLMPSTGSRPCRFAER